jgi:type VII secretion-associated serine protease mycosin
MRRLRTVLAASTATATVMLSAAPPAMAVPTVRPDEWWMRPTAWGITNLIWPISKGSGVTVAVLDSGVNARLPELSGAVLPGADMNGDGTDGRRDLDPWDGGHGTGMAGLIAAQGTGPTGLVGVAPEAKILPVRMGDSGTNKAPYNTELSQAIRFATDHGAKIISISNGQDAEPIPGHCFDDVQEAVAYAARHDVITVAAMGNDGDRGNYPDYPAACAGVLAVGAVDSAGRAWPMTTRQDYVSVAAPGVNIGLLGSKGEYRPNTWGTSQATALTSGVLALVRSAHPDWSARFVAQRVIGTAAPSHAGRWNSATGFGSLRVDRVIDSSYQVSASTAVPTYQRLDQWIAQHHPQAAGRLEGLPRRRNVVCPMP